MEQFLCPPDLKTQLFNLNFLTNKYLCCHDACVVIRGVKLPTQRECYHRSNDNIPAIYFLALLSRKPRIFRYRYITLRDVFWKCGIFLRNHPGDMLIWVRLQPVFSYTWLRRYLYVAIWIT